MAEYIERETALQIIDNYAKTVTEDGLVGVNAVRDIVSIICPTADVEPVKHGEWAGTVCCCCGESTVNYYDCDYCPNCGAKMDGEEVQE